MPITARPYVNATDFDRLLTFLTNVRTNIDQAHYLHIGDFVWQVFHMLADYQPADLLEVWEDDNGMLLGFVLVYPSFGFFDLQLDPQYRGSPLEAEMLAWTEGYFQQVRQHDAPAALFTLVQERDVQRIMLLEQHGFARGDAWLYLQRSLNVSVPHAQPPVGFTIRSVIGEAEAPARAAVLAAAFGARPQPERYRQFMRAPRYIRALDIVAVAPDNRFGAFAMGWVDTTNRVGQFEPVGTAPDFRRQGLGQAVLVEGLRRMQAHGARDVMVVVEEAAQAAVAVYHSVGFEPRWNLYLYRR